MTESISGSIGSTTTPKYNEIMTSASKELLKSAWSVGRQMASLFLGAVAFAVAIAWNGAVQSIIVLWTPKDSTQATRQTTTVRYNLIAASVLTLIAVVIAALLTLIYGKDVQKGQAKEYGLG